MALDIVNDWLYINGKAAPEVKSPVKKYGEGKNICDYLIFHYTASTTAKSAHNNFLDPATQVSWHLTIDRDGVVSQLYDFRKITWHAGKSGWGQLVGMNKYSIGIEMVNAGPLSYVNGSYYTWTKQMVPVAHVFFDANGNPWQKYTQEQLQAAEILASTICRKYKCRDILGHEMISPGRKQDPGPAFWPTLNTLRTRLKSGKI